MIWVLLALVIQCGVGQDYGGPISGAPAPPPPGAYNAPAPAPAPAPYNAPAPAPALYNAPAPAPVPGAYNAPAPGAYNVPAPIPIQDGSVLSSGGSVSGGISLPLRDGLHVSTGPVIAPSGGIYRPGRPQDIQSLAFRRQIVDTSVACAKTYMEVVITFSEVFDGLIYPYGKFEHCLLWHGPRNKEARMTLRHGICGAENELLPVPGSGGIKTFLVDPMIEHHLMIQWDRDLVGEDDMNVIVRCERPSDYNQTVAWSVTAKDKVAIETRAEHPGPTMYMEIQIGEGPGAPPFDPSVGILVGDTMTILLILSDEVFWFDSNILDCVAVSGGDTRPQIQWSDRDTGRHSPTFGQMKVIENGCSVKKNIFSDFYKERQTLNNGLMVTTHYAHFKAFRFPMSHKIIIQCNIQVCYEDCPELLPCSESFHPRTNTNERRKRRDVQNSATQGNEMDRIQLYKTVEVFLPDEGALEQVHIAAVPGAAIPEPCYTTTSFLTATLVLAALVLILAATLAYTCIKLVVSRPSFFSPRKPLN